jgi:hypothetical protein
MRDEDCYHKLPHIKDEIESCDWEFCDDIEGDVTCVAYVEPFSDIDDAFDDLLDDLGIEKEKRLKKKELKWKDGGWKVVRNPNIKDGGWDVVRETERRDDDYWTTSDDVWTV